MKPHLKFEEAFWADGLQGIVGLDEAGRGALAGPVMAATVLLPPNSDKLLRNLEGVRDSKLLTPTSRQHWSGVIQAEASAWAVGQASALEIDAVGIVPATRLAMERALAKLHQQIDFLLIDYLLLPEYEAGQVSLIRGDRKVLSIAAASILAKVARDEMMIDMHQHFSGYAFANNKGYGTAQHRSALMQLGPCDYHRQTFQPVIDASHITRV